MKPQHTKGPYQVWIASDGECVITGNDGTRYIAYLFRFPDQQEQTDAQLLAAAPQMRALLDKLHQFFIRYVMVTYSEDYREEMEELFYAMNDLLVKTPTSK